MCSSSACDTDFLTFFDIPSTVNNNVKRNVCFVLSRKHSRRPGTHNFNQYNPESASMASHGDNAEGGVNEEFTDIIKWRSGMLVYLYIFAELFYSSY